jgi:membrane protein DedA with SNARE-associated domain
MEQGWDPEVKKYFQKILNTIGYGLLWLMAALTAGLYLGLAYHHDTLYSVIFYTIFVISLCLLIRYYYRLWKK